MPRKTIPATDPSTPKARRPRKPAAAPEAPQDSSPPVQAKRLLDAGFKAFGEVRDDMVSQQGRVFEAMLGVNPTEAWTDPSKTSEPTRAEAAPDPFGFRKFEDIFDQRVARALERLGMPSPAELQALRDEVRALRKALQQPKSATTKRERGG
jgi:Poly(hydroxyalcanoate) granule associated protein (phasin)